MNGVYINSQRIPTATPTQLEDKDLIGIGAVNPAQAEDHFVFQVLRINKKLVIAQTLVNDLNDFQIFTDTIKYDISSKIQVADRQHASSRGNLHRRSFYLFIFKWI